MLPLRGVSDELLVLVLAVLFTLDPVLTDDELARVASVLTLELDPTR